MGQTEEELRAILAGIDATHETAAAAIEDDITSTGAGMATAGTEYQGAVDSALASSNTAVGDYQTFLDDVNSALDSIGDATALIAAIGTVTAVSVPTSGSPDCAAADVSTALSSLATELNIRITQIKAAATALDAATQALKDVVNQIMVHEPAAENSEAEKAASYATINANPFV